MSAPLVVNTKDGAVWTRREGTRSGEALYAPEKCGVCPQFVTLTELAKLGITGSADALPVPVGPERLSPQERAMILGLIGEAKPATSGLLVSFGESVRNCREHEHPTWEDLYCMNLSSYMGERMAPVLRRLVDVESENERLTARVTELEAANAGLDDLRVRALDKNDQLRDRIAELESQLAAKDRPADEGPIAFALTDKAKEHCDHPNGHGPYGCAGCGAFRPADEDDVRPQVRKLRWPPAGQRTTAEDPHDSPLHQTHRLGRDLPETGGAE